MDCVRCEDARVEESAVVGVFFLRCFKEIPGWGSGRVVDRYKGDKSIMSGRPAWCREEETHAE